MQRRNFLKVAPIAAAAGAAVSVMGRDGQQFEVSADKRYIFVFNTPDDALPMSQGTAENLRRHLESKGFRDVVVIVNANLQIYEVDPISGDLSTHQDSQRS